MANTVGSNLNVPKALTLKQLTATADAPTISDFGPQLEATAPVVNRPSSVNTAAYAAALSPEGTTAQGMIDSYHQALSEDTLEGQSQTATNLISQAKSNAMQANVDPLMNILSNPNVSDEQKRAAVGQVYDKNSAIYSPANVLSTKALAAPTVGTPSKEADEARYDMSAITTEMNARKAAIQDVYNSAASQSQPDLQQHFYDFGVGLIPGARQYMVSKIAADTSDAPIKAFVRTFVGGVGTSTQYMRDQIAQLPADQQLGAAQSMADAINAHSNILISRPADEVRRSVLQGVIGGQGYSDHQATADNLASWADLAMGAGAIGKGVVKGGKAVSELAGALKDYKTNQSSAEGIYAAFKRDFDANYAAEKGTVSAASEAADTVKATDGTSVKTDSIVPQPEYTPQNKNSLGQFYKSREQQVYDSSTGIPYQKMPAENVLSSAVRDSIRSQVQPVSLYQNYKDTNIDMARNAFESMTLDSSGEAAQALAGTTRTDALANAMMPEVRHVDGSVANKVSAPDAISQTRDAIPADIVDFIKHDGLTQYAQAEKAAARSLKANQFQEAIGMTPRQEMFQLLPDHAKFTDTPQGFSFRGVYGPQDTGFSDATDALETAKFALRNTGVDESALGLLKREGESYIPVDHADVAGKKGDYLVSVEHDYKITPSDVTEASGWQPLDVKLNFFDRWTPMGGTQGTFSNIILDPQSMLDKVIVAPAVVGTDRAATVEKALLNQVGDFAKTFKGLSKAEQHVVNNEITEANFLSRDYDYRRLSASGASAEAIDTLTKFKSFQDTVWHLKNEYFAKQLDNAGYEEFMHTASNTNLPVRRVAKASVSGGVNVWDAATDTIKNLDRAAVDAAYAQSGGVAKLRQPILTTGGDSVEHVLHTNSAADGYLRKFTPTSQVTNYRPGYYGVSYKDPYHIIEKVKDANGKVIYEHSVATARDAKGANTTVNRMNAQGPNEFYHRKATEINDKTTFEHDFDVNQAHGMSSFKRRGQLLEDSTSNTVSLENANVRNPVETMVAQAVPLSKKVAMADVIDAIKQRGISQYSDLLPKDDFGRAMIPRDMNQIRYRGGATQDQSRVADARTTFGYANYLENSYVNLLDDGIKSAMHNVADLIGQVSASGERVTRELANKSLTNGMKSVSYYAFLGLAPLRQLIVQGHQAVMLAALNAEWVASTKAFSQPAYMALRTMGMDATHATAATLAKSAWGSSQEAERVFQQFRRAGIGAAVDHQNMISGAVNDMAANMIANSRNSMVSNVLKVPRTVAAFSRKIGFDAGEFYSQSMSWLAHRDLAAKQGLNVFADDVADKVTGAARNYTGNMNSAGDLASNKNALSMVFQYTQNTQKMILNLTTNRAIPWQIKVKMATLGVALFGTGSIPFVGSSKAVQSVQDPNAKEALTYGLEGWFLNKALSLATGQKSEIDWSGLSPFNAFGTLDMIHGIFTTNVGEIIANSPSASMFFGSNPRVSKAVGDMARYTNLIDDFQDPTTFLGVAKDFANISSGMSAGFKAAYLLKTKQKMSSSGNITQENVDSVNAIGAILGFPTETESQLMKIAQNNSKNKKAVEADFNEWFKTANQHYSNPDLAGDDLTHTQKMLTEFYRVYGNNNEDMQRLMDQKLKANLKTGDASMYNMVMRNCPLYSRGDCMKLIDSTPFSDPKEKENLKTILNAGNQFQDKPYDGKDN